MCVNENETQNQDYPKIFLSRVRRQRRIILGVAMLILTTVSAVIIYLALRNNVFADHLKNSVKHLTIQTLLGVKYVMIQTPLGEIRGKEVAWEGEPNVVVNQFLGIPYAEDATQYRFLRTQKKKPWTGVLDALEFGPSCIQGNNDKLQSENCLNLNIWTPANVTKNHPVVIFIHGGSFTIGSNSDFAFNGSAWASIGDTIMVVINYRLGVFGFLDAQIEEVAGNQGIYDMVEALKWTYENIAAFGGDPELITLMGESAGSISISTLSLYEPARRYFQRGIMMSGSLFVRNGNIPYLQQQLLKNITENLCNVPYSDALAAIKCLQGINAAQLNDHLNKNPLLKLAISPDGGHQYSMFQSPLLQLYKNASMRPIPMLLGITQNEGKAFLSILLESLLKIRINNVSDLYAIQRDSFDLFMKLSNKMFLQFDEEFIEKVTNRYVPPDVQNGTKLIDGWSNLIGDLIMNCPTRYYAEFAKKFNSNVYCYEDAYFPELNYFPNWMGVTHSSDLRFAFGVLSDGKNHSRFWDEKMNRVMIKAFAEFAKYGKMSDTKTWLAQDMSFGRCAFLDKPELGKMNGSLGSSDNCDFLKEAYFTPFNSLSH